MGITVIRNVGKVIISLDPPVIDEQVDIVIDGSIISSVGKDAGKDVAADKIIDGSGKLIYPGMVCSHHHYYSGLSRGIMADMGPTPDFISTLKQLWWRLDRALDLESVYYSSLVCSMDAVRCGTTAVIDHHSSPSAIGGSLSAIKEGFERTGLRGMTCYEVTDRNGGKEELEQGIEENINFAAIIDDEKRKLQDTGEHVLVEAAVGGHAPFTIPDYGLELMGEAVRATGRGIHIHVAEDRYDVSVSHHRHGKSVIERLDEFGLLGEKSILVHGLFLSREDIRLLNNSNGFLVHNSRSNMNNHVGYCSDIKDIRNAALGTDGIGADMLEELKFAFFKNRDAGGSLWPPFYLKALNRGNEILARNFNGRFGCIGEGCKADLVISDYSSPTPLLPQNLAGHMAFGMNSAGVESVIINGRLVMEKREFPFDTEKIYREAAAHARKVWDRMNKIKA